MKTFKKIINKFKFFLKKNSIKKRNNFLVNYKSKLSPEETEKIYTKHLTILNETYMNESIKKENYKKEQIKKLLNGN